MLCLDTIMLIDHNIIGLNSKVELQSFRKKLNIEGEL